MTALVERENRDGVAYLFLNRPDKLNALNVALFEELESRRLGFSIKEASTLGNIRIVDSAYVDSAVSPQITTVFGIMILSFRFIFDNLSLRTSFIVD